MHRAPASTAPCQIDVGRPAVGDQDGVTGRCDPILDGVAASNSLADIAMYYWKTDLRPAGARWAASTEEGTNIDVSSEQRAARGRRHRDLAAHEHVHVGLGVPGVLHYADNYLHGGSADYNAIVQGTKNWPDPQTTAAHAERSGAPRRPLACGRQRPRPVPQRQDARRAHRGAQQRDLRDHRGPTAPPPPRRPATSSRSRATTSRTSRNTRP